MSKNNWETQPRLSNGEFTFRKFNFMGKIFETFYKQKNKTYKPKEGGSYGQLRKITYGQKNLEIHHMPAASVSKLSRWKGPSIIMDKTDHKFTSSHGNNKRAIRFRMWQKKLISENKFLQAERMDIINLYRKFGTKYEKGIKQKLEYDEQLKTEGVINGQD